MAKNELRLSQVIRTFGPGAMVDLPNHSVIIGGLDQWDIRGGSKSISEPRMTARLEQFLKREGRLPETATLSLRTPPIRSTGRAGPLGGLRSFIFPAWFVCDQVEAAPSGLLRRRLVKWTNLDAHQRNRYQLDDGTWSKVTPIRFVGACPNGHVQDVDWRYAVHGPTACAEPMWLEDRGTSGEPADTSVVCACGQGLSLQDAFLPGRLGPCMGKRPWLLDEEPVRCGHNLKLLTRTATNAYFPQTYTLISLPAAEDELMKLVHELADELKNVSGPEELAMARRFNSRLDLALGDHANGEVFDRLVRIRQAAIADVAGSAKSAEFEVFASGRAKIGEDVPNSRLFARTLERDCWTERPGAFPEIASVVAVDRLREVSCLYGFTRFEQAPSSGDEEMEDVSLAVRGAALSRDASWLPAIEQFGEGVFLRIDPAMIAAWMTRDEVRRRAQELFAGHLLWSRRFEGAAPAWPGVAYVLLHSLSHALMSEIALDCGYPSSSLRERVYAERSPDGSLPSRLGILIYTATPGAQGTLGGLVASTSRFSTIFRSALDRLRICSNDPICADHMPDAMSGDRATHGAACHGCLLISETSCEARNLFLDRRLLVDTMAAGGEALF